VLLLPSVVIVLLAGFALALSRALKTLDLRAIAVLGWFQLALVLLYVAGGLFLLWVLIGTEYFVVLAALLGVSLVGWYWGMGQALLAAPKYAELTGLEPAVQSAFDLAAPSRPARGLRWRRRVFTRKNTGMVAALLGLAGLLLGAMIAVFEGTQWLDSAWADRAGEGDRVLRLLVAIVGQGLGLMSGIGAWLAYRRARRYAASEADEVRQKDPRPPVLLLRSFVDDTMRAKGSWRGNVGGTLGAYATFEELLDDVLWRFGPVVAIGRPGEQLPPLGAAREYLRHEDWQSVVETRIASAKMIVAVVGGTEGLAWEIRALALFNALSRVMLVFPPRPQGELESRWQLFRWHVLRDRQRDMPDLKLPASLDVAKALILTFSHCDQPTVITGASRTRWDYEEALSRAARLIATHRPTDEPAGTPA
jgi:hypothetical protein